MSTLKQSKNNDIPVAIFVLNFSLQSQSLQNQQSAGSPIRTPHSLMAEERFCRFAQSNFAEEMGLLMSGNGPL